MKTYAQFNQDLRTNESLYRTYCLEQKYVLNRIKDAVKDNHRIWKSDTERNREFYHFIKFYFGKEFRQHFYKSYYVWKTCIDTEALVRKSIAYFIL